MNNHQTYLDYGATTPVDPRVLDVMLPYFNETFGNPSSVHQAGQKAEAAMEISRATIAELLGCSPKEILFTSGGSESDNLALRGTAHARRGESGANRILVSNIEHEAITKTAKALGKDDNFDVEYLPVDSTGMLQPDVLKSELGEDVAVVSIMYANNEIGTINPLAELASICHNSGVPIHTDAVQGASQLEVDVDKLGVDLASIGAHKFYGPKGIGALFVREGVKMRSFQRGGSQEFGLRAGTENVASIVGMAEALRLTVAEREARTNRYRQLRDQLIDGVLSTMKGVKLTGHPELRLPNHASFAFKQTDGNQLVAALDLAGYECSSGSACKTGLPEPSRVLEALGLDSAWTMGSLRVTVGQSTSSEAINHFVQTLPDVVARLNTQPVAS